MLSRFRIQENKLSIGSRLLKTERRAVARYRAKLAVQINMDEYSFGATSMEVSLRGLRIVCEGPTATSIFSRYIQVTPGENITANIHIKTPKPRGLTDTIECKTRVISVNRISQSSYVVGFSILEFDEDCRELWNSYISTKR